MSGRIDESIHSMVLVLKWAWRGNQEYQRSKTLLNCFFIPSFIRSFIHWFTHLIKKFFYGSKLQEPYQWFIIKEHPPNSLIFSGLVSFAWFFHWSATQTVWTDPTICNGVSTGFLKTGGFQARYSSIPGSPLVGTKIFPSKQFHPSFGEETWDKKQRVTTVTTGDAGCVFFLLRFWIVWSGMHGIMVGKKEIVFHTTCSEDDVCF